MEIKNSDLELAKNLLIMREGFAKELAGFGFSVLRLSVSPLTFPQSDEFKKAREVFEIIKNLEIEIARRLGSVFRLRTYEVGAYDRFIIKETRIAIRAINHVLKSEKKND